MSIKKLLKDPFYRRVIVGGGCLLLAIVCLSGLLLFDGPRMRRVDLDPSKVTSQSNQTITLRSNQPLKRVDKAQVSISPAVGFSVSTSGESIVLQLKQRLDYDTEYRVTVHDVESLRNKKSTYSTSFKTSSAQYYYLQRNQAAGSDNPFSAAGKVPDEIIRSTISGREEAIFVAHKIIDFAVLDGSLAVSYLTDDNKPVFIMYDEKTKKSKNIDLPVEGTVSNLASSSSKQFLGFTLTNDSETSPSQVYDHVLFVYNTDNHYSSAVKGIDGNKLTVRSWKFHPDGTSILAATETNGAWILDSYSQQSPLPLGTYYRIGGFSRDGVRLVVDDPLKGAVALNLKDRTKTAPTANPINGVKPYITDISILQDGEGLLKVLWLFNESSQVYSEAFVVDTGKGERKVYEASGAKTQVYGHGLSGNDQYLTVETSAVEGDYELDQYPEESIPTNIQTVIVETKSGKILKTIDGFKLTWK